MRTFQTWVASALFGATALTAAAPAWAQTCTCPSDTTVYEPEVTTETGATVRPRVIVADEPPPPLPVYDQPPIPAEGYIWTPGYWNWNGEEHYWVPGTWVRPPRVGLLWTPGYWAVGDGGYAFHRGYWGERVGFYGGIAYGFGYGGVGFEGGRWDGDHFAYNRSVTNIRDVHITNVYNEQVTVINNTSRASFNGPNGVPAKPTEAELAVAKERHVAPTAAQVSHVRAAAHTEANFASVNDGKPAIAATAKPGELKGASVVPAKAAGGPLPEKAAEPKATPTPEPAKTPEAKEAPKATPEPAKTAEPKVEPKPEPTKTVEPKTEAKPEPTKTTEPKADVKPKAEPTKAAEPKAEPKKAEPAKEAEPKVEPKKAEPAKATEPKAEPKRAEPAKGAEPKAEPKKAEPAKEAEPKAEARPKAEPKAAEPKAEAKPEPKKACGRPGEPACPK